MLLRVELTHLVDLKLLRRLLVFFLHRFVVGFGKLQHLLDRFLVGLVMSFEVSCLQSFRPSLLVKIHQHLLFQLAFPVADRDGIVMPVETVNQSLDRRLVEVADDRRRLSWLLPQHHHLRVDGTKGIDDNLSLDRLNRVHDHSDCSLIQRLEALLRVDINAGEPAAESRMRVIPTNNHLRSPSLLEHIKHLRLEDGIHSLHANSCSALRHCENIANANGIVVDKVSKHKTHDLHRHASPSVLEHLQERQARDVNLF
mmetsp:Transcript_17893/g.36694  ORF Transcript_17893/g.36694 Transcript_17893/m.36694 type:complete len:256 (+) Transcript_17893:205-972(+)